MKARQLLPALLLLALGTAGAQVADAHVYKWKDEKGVTHFSDTPPPASAAKAVELKTYDTGGGTQELPYELQLAVRDHPVTLYTTAACAACDQGRAQLRKRGIPYNEKTVLTAADMEALKRAGGNGRLPLLTIGRMRLVGYDSAAWDDALTTVGYPAQSMLPPNYAYRAPASAAPPPLPTDADRATSAQAKAPPAEVRRPAPVNAPPDFQF
ncbi:hypothetical protein GCM10027277_21180 [Pseudoduganella ginsengisoli]|uniref:DUF4124 domain-containing protein n=1 Tax=Pseudoduganella ginsengisoli TaxID=1462440 RepID=A0A6L6PUD9_9BURK|nr:glutaredoxin family protein [Pseudoduganella ginsengisoli]MTW00628.1 DUF4124 domain-containing protein [Pseudoduganella ginsengisoli]